MENGGIVLKKTIDIVEDFVSWLIELLQEGKTLLNDHVIYWIESKKRRDKKDE